MNNLLQTWLGSMMSLSRRWSTRLALPKGANPIKPFWLPPDGPLDAKGRKRYDEYRLEPLIQALHERLQAWLASQQTSMPPRIGVFGGLGQGTSTVVVNVVENLQRERSFWQKLGEVLLGPRIVRFDISYFKANDLEWRFLTAVLWQRFLRNFAVVGLLSSVALLIGFSLGCVLQRLSPIAMLGGLPAYGVGFWSLPFLGLPILAKLKQGLPSLGKTFRGVDPASNLYLAQQDQRIQTFSGFFFALPDVVIIDDLDRASVEQQRSFLRSMSRFSRELGFAVVVCMDDSELLAAPKNPETPEELLRKTITAELRIPDRTREDTALLAAVCVREFSRENEALAAALTTVQFVSDLTRILLIEAQQAPASPRKIWRILTALGLQARQLDIASADDLGALLRIDGLCRLLPPLRRHIDRLREALEGQRLEIFNKLLADLGLDDGHSRLAQAFFQKTRMMQPAMQDGWFRLLGGFGGYGQSASTREPVNTWCVDWLIAKDSITLFRLFAEALELDAASYEHDMALELKVSAADELGSWWFIIPGGLSFPLPNLPLSFRETSSQGFFGQCWLLWVSVLASSTAERKTALYQRARRWINTTPTTLQPCLLDLYWREVLADADLWDSLDSTSRQNWWDQAHQDAQTSTTPAQGIPIQRFFALPLRNEDFNDAWMALGRKGSIRDGRNALFWWRHITPEVSESRSQLVDYPNFAAKIWPAPQPERNDTAAWREVLAQHFKAVIALNKVQRAFLTPEPLLYAWQRAQSVLAMDDCLDLINLLACDESALTGQRWSLETSRPWVKGLSEKRREDLASVIKEAPALSVDISLFPQRRLVLIVIAILLKCPPQNPNWLVRGIAPDKLNELLNYLEEVGELPEWLVSTTG